MKNKPVLIILLIFLCCVFSVFGKYAGSAASRSRNRHLQTSFNLFLRIYNPRTLLHNKEHLMLSPQQIQKIQDIYFSFEEKNLRAQAEISIAELRISALVKKEPTDRFRLEKLIIRLEKQKIMLFREFIFHLLDVKQVLTHRQRTALQKKEKQYTVPAQTPFIR